MSYGFRPRLPYGYRFRGKSGGPRGGPAGPRGPPNPPWGFGGPNPGRGRFPGPFNSNPNFQDDDPGGQFDENFGPHPMGMGEPDGPPMMMPNQLTPDDVMMWLTRQHPTVVHQIMLHSRWLLEKVGFPLGENGPNDSNTWYESADEGTSNSGSLVPGGGPPSAKRSRMGGLGWSGSGKNVQWTPEGWVPKDNSHKVTTKMKPLPKIELIPPVSTTYPDADADRQKLRMLENNVGMMSAELTKICHRFKITNFDRENLDPYPDAQKEKLKTAVVCVKNAEKTLSNFKEFLKTDKYQEWNEAEDKKRDQQVQDMIGMTPEGVPHKKPGAEDS